jgi:hypothetical protein
MIRFRVPDDWSLPQASGITECRNINYERKCGQLQAEFSFPISVASQVILYAFAESQARAVTHFTQDRSRAESAKQIALRP